MVSDWGRGSYGNHFRVEGLKIGTSGAMDSRTVAHLDEGWQPRILPLADGRVAIVDGFRVQLVQVN